MSIEKAALLLVEELRKAKKMPIGTVSKGRKKIAEGKWVPVEDKSSGKGNTTKKKALSKQGKEIDIPDDAETIQDKKFPDHDFLIFENKNSDRKSFLIADKKSGLVVSEGGSKSSAKNDLRQGLKNIEDEGMLKQKINEIFKKKTNSQKEVYEGFDNYGKPVYEQNEKIKNIVSKSGSNNEEIEDLNRAIDYVIKHIKNNKLKLDSLESDELNKKFPDSLSVNIKIKKNIKKLRDNGLTKDMIFPQGDSNKDKKNPSDMSVDEFIEHEIRTGNPNHKNYEDNKIEKFKKWSKNEQVDSGWTPGEKNEFRSLMNKFEKIKEKSVKNDPEKSKKEAASRIMKHLSVLKEGTGYDTHVKEKYGTHENFAKELMKIFNGEKEFESKRGSIPDGITKDFIKNALKPIMGKQKDKG